MIAYKPLRFKRRETTLEDVRQTFYLVWPVVKMTVNDKN